MMGMREETARKFVGKMFAIRGSTKRDKSNPTVHLCINCEGIDDASLIVNSFEDKDYKSNTKQAKSLAKSLNEWADK
jgi:hypothetical protein